MVRPSVQSARKQTGDRKSTRLATCAAKRGIRKGRYRPGNLVLKRLHDMSRGKAMLAILRQTWKDQRLCSQKSPRRLVPRDLLLAKRIRGSRSDDN
ncbi:Hypp4229 [Branchiostoma lanceolatum]|uniref:Hypp4229 protein n=1 Tax=Branchiostoma lanceolatum TaxID=7740 RepID=A0A8K0A6D1_BRALA|nr:Hypp4229 [Branchiostoma lanceolatum]